MLAWQSAYLARRASAAWPSLNLAHERARAALAGVPLPGPQEEGYRWRP